MSVSEAGLVGVDVSIRCIRDHFRIVLSMFEERLLFDEYGEASSGLVCLKMCARV